MASSQKLLSLLGLKYTSTNNSAGLKNHTEMNLWEIVDTLIFYHLSFLRLSFRTPDGIYKGFNISENRRKEYEK